MNVRELKEKLSQYPDDMPVIFTWEGTYHTKPDFSVEHLDESLSDHSRYTIRFPEIIGKDFLEIDVE